MNVDWPSGVITIYKTDPFVTWSGGSVYNMDTNGFRLALKDAEDSEIGMSFTDTHKHNTTVLLGGIEYARILEILAPYTITFDDTGGGWVCNLIGSNNNILDRANLTSVQVRSNNSAGLVQMAEIQHGIFNGCVTVDVLKGVAGTQYPVGTPIQPSNNFQDAKTIANYRGFSTIQVIGSANIDNIDLSDMSIIGVNAMASRIVLGENATLTRCEIMEAQVTGYVDGDCLFRSCYIDGIKYFNGIFHECAFNENPIVLDGQNPAIFLKCYSGSFFGQPTIIDCNNKNTPLVIRGWLGNVVVRNRSADNTFSSINFNGSLNLEASIIAGNWDISGTGDLINNATGSALVDHSKLVHGDEIAESVWLHTKGVNVPTKADVLASVFAR